MNNLFLNIVRFLIGFLQSIERTTSNLQEIRVSAFEARMIDFKVQTFAFNPRQGEIPKWAFTFYHEGKTIYESFLIPQPGEFYVGVYFDGNEYIAELWRKDNDGWLQFMALDNELYVYMD